LILALLSCAPSALLVPDDACRLSGFGAPTVEVSCGGETTTVTWDAPLRVGGLSGAWDGLSFFAGASTTGGGGLSVGWRPGELGVELLEGGLSAAAGFRPEQGDAADETCEELVVTGLPEAWVSGGAWSPGDPVATDWAPDWPSTCALSPRAWATVRAELTCAGEPVAALQLLAPDRYVVTLDSLWRPVDASATWSEAFSATCEGEVVDDVTATLAGDRLETTLFTATREDGGWRVEEACAPCEGMEIAIEGLPEWWSK
jgi:hypothetical protein